MQGDGCAVAGMEDWTSQDFADDVDGVRGVPCQVGPTDIGFGIVLECQPDGMDGGVECEVRGKARFGGTKIGS